jgi:protein-tyrosine phosphatase
MSLQKLPGSVSCALNLLVLTALLSITACSRSVPLEARPAPDQLVSEQGESIRKLPFDGPNNFRDMGGYVTADGKKLKWGMLYRSDKLSDLSATDEQYLEKLAIRRIVDFRSEQERTEEPDRIAPDSSIAIVNKPITIKAVEVGQIGERIVSSDATPEEMGQLLVDANRQMVEDFTPVYREYMQELLVSANYPSVFHCTAGKDRTGLAAALVLSALGVPRDIIIQDYLASNTYNAEHIDKMLMLIEISSFFRANSEAVRAIFAVEERYLNEAFIAIDEHYGSMDNYLTAGLGLGEVERQKLRGLLLQ